MTTRERTFPVAEIFGPTLQGEGVDQGKVAHFVRFGGCDYKCDWCDTPHAVLPKEVSKLERLRSDEIVHRVKDLGPAPWVILTGGNPCLHELDFVVHDLQRWGFNVAVETQGSRWKDWLSRVDRLCISPKPPSAKTPVNAEEVRLFYERARAERDSGFNNHRRDWVFSKVVIFDQVDLDWCIETIAQEPVPLYLSAGNDAGRTVGNPDRVDDRTRDEAVLDLLEKSRWLTDRVLETPDLSHVTVQSQYHVLLWGNELGH